MLRRLSPARQVLVLLSAMLMVAGLSACSLPSLQAQNPESLPAPTSMPSLPLTVRYELSGSPTVANTIYVTYGRTQGSAKQARVSLPWTHSFPAQAGEYVYVSGQARGGPVSCRVLVDGRVMKEATARASGSVASCALTLADR